MPSAFAVFKACRKCDKFVKRESTGKFTEMDWMVCRRIGRARLKTMAGCPLNKKKSGLFGRGVLKK